MMALWATVSALTALSNNYVGLLLTRFFLGITEAPYYPGAVYLLSVFYNRKEIATRIAILYTGNVLATAFAGLIAAGVFYGMDNAMGLAGWQWLFILQGAVTFVMYVLFSSFPAFFLVDNFCDAFKNKTERKKEKKNVTDWTSNSAIFGYFLLPDFPLTTKWLTPEERQLAYSRMEFDTVQNKGETGTLAGLKQAVRDPVVWLFAAMAHMHLAANGFKNFVSDVSVQSLAFF